MSSDEEADTTTQGFWGEDGEWYQHRHNRLTKEDQIYGIFNHSKPSPSGRPQPAVVNMNSLSVPLLSVNPCTLSMTDPHYRSSLAFNFVKGGVQTVNDQDSGTNTKQSPVSTTKSSESESKQDAESILSEWEKIQKAKRQLHESRNGPSLGTHGLPTQLGAASKSKCKHSTLSPVHKIGVKRERGYAQWTRTEKRAKFGGMSFAERYLQKHGFKGRLGRNAGGIANPVKQADPRRNNEGLGFGGKDSQIGQPKNVEQELQDIHQRTQREKERLAETTNLWKIIDENVERKRECNYPMEQPLKKRKISYRTTRGGDGDDMNLKMRIHDYTKEQVVVTTTDRITTEDHGDRGSLSGLCPAFRHNVDRICDLIQERKVVLHRESENLQHQRHSLQIQVDVLRKDRAKQSERAQRLNALKAVLSRLEAADSTSSDALYGVFEELQRRFYSEYLQYKLWRLFPTVIFPKLKQEMSGIHKFDDDDSGALHISATAQWMVDVLVKWRPLMTNNFVIAQRRKFENGSTAKDVYSVLVEQVMEPQIRRLLYEWDPTERENNGHFVGIFERLKTVLPSDLYCGLMRHLIIPRLCHLVSEWKEIGTDSQTADCIVSWSFLFESVDAKYHDILSANIARKWKRFARTFHGGNGEHHKLHIEALLKWRPVLEAIHDSKQCGTSVFAVIVNGSVTGTLKRILSDSVVKMEDGTEAFLNEIHLVHCWYLREVLSHKEYVSLLQNGFFEPWLLTVHRRFKMVEMERVKKVGASRARMEREIEAIWNGMFAVIKNGVFRSEFERITKLAESEGIEMYLNSFLDLMSWVVTKGEDDPLPSYEIVRGDLEERMAVKEGKRDRKRKKEKKERAKGIKDRLWTDEYREDLKSAKSRVQVVEESDIGIMELIEMKAQNHGIEFYLDSNKQNDGKKVYKFGKTYICLYDKAVFAKHDGDWKAVDLQELLRLA